MTADLKPCPFCGEHPHLYGAQVMVDGDCPESIDCTNDDCPVNPTTGYMKYEDAVAAWNTLAPTVSDTGADSGPGASTSQPGEAPVSSAPAPTGRSTNSPLPTLEWPDDSPPPSWWGKGPNGELTRVYRSYEDYCDD